MTLSSLLFSFLQLYSRCLSCSLTTTKHLTCLSVQAPTGNQPITLCRPQKPRTAEPVICLLVGAMPGKLNLGKERICPDYSVCFPLAFSINPPLCSAAVLESSSPFSKTEGQAVNLTVWLRVGKFKLLLLLIEEGFGLVVA